jgi:hypothetical protein
LKKKEQAAKTTQPIAVAPVSSDVLDDKQTVAFVQPINAIIIDNTIVKVVSLNNIGCILSALIVLSPL